MPGDVEGMGLAGHDQLHRALLVAQEAREAVRVPEEQVGALVGGEPPREADGERVGAQDVVGLAAPHAQGPLPREAAAREHHQALAAQLVDAPELPGGDVLRAVPHRGVLGPLAQRRADVALEQLVHLAAEPARRVDPVGDAGDRHLVDRQVGPEPAPHAPGRVAVQLGDAVGEARGAQRQRRHPELGIAVRVRGQGGQLLPGHPDRRRERLEVGARELGLEGLVARGDRGVGGEDRRGAGLLEGLGEVQAGALHQRPEPLERQQRRVALVHVEHRGAHAGRGERPDAPHAQQDLLPDPHLAIAAVEGARDRACLGRVALHVRVEQEERNAAHLDPAHRGAHGLPADLDLHVQGRPRGVALVGERQIGPVGGRVALALAAVGPQRLAEVPAVVEQAHAHQRHAEVGRRLQVVARQDPQAARVERDAGVEPELEREVGHEHVPRLGRGRPQPAGLRGVRVEPAGHPGHHGHEALVGRRGVQLLLRQAPQQRDRVVAEPLPGLGVEPGEEVPGLGAPRRPHVACDLAEPGEAFRERGVDVDLVDLHAAISSWCGRIRARSAGRRRDRATRRRSGTGEA